MTKPLANFIEDEEIAPFLRFIFALPDNDSHISLHNDIKLAFQDFMACNPNLPRMSSSKRFIQKVQEILHLEDRRVVLYRHRRASSRVYEVKETSSMLVRLSIKDFLGIKERLANPDLPLGQRTMEINMAPFYDYGPDLKDPGTIGNGIRHLNRYMSANVFHQRQKWNNTLFEFLKLHQLHGEQLLLDGEKIKTAEELESCLEDAVDFLERCDCQEDLKRLKNKLKHLGFLSGWGNNQARMLETMNLLQDIIEQPNEDTLEEFLSRVPMVSKVVLLSPHGWFGQENVLGRPDTGGQVVYILDQAKALEQYLAKDLRLAGLDIKPKVLIATRLIPEADGTSCDQRLEKVKNTQNVYILRTPFRDLEGNIIPHWISRFRIWPYLDQYSVDVEKDIVEELGGRPDLFVGNYSDGNLVATNLSKNLGVIQCNIAHALEKSKYLFSDLYWDKFEDEYNFSVQIMADLISMNHANFIITSTGQEITGTDTSIGQYESYQFFSMPGLLQVINGIDLFHPRFNVIPPGVSTQTYFPYTQKKKRDKADTDRLKRIMFEINDEECFGELYDPEKPPIFSIARLDRIKNLTGLVEAYGQDANLRERANLILVASSIDIEKSTDSEERDEIRKMHAIIELYNLYGSIRWIGKRLSKSDTGEVYRIMADRAGIFVQPALFEAFGLTILEAMHSGLPVFATEFGGPQEIIIDGESGFLINPTDPAAMTSKIFDFFSLAEEDPKHWRKFSKSGMQRAQKYFTWELYCRRLTRLTKVYGFWRYSISDKAKYRLGQYCHLMYHLFFKHRAFKIE